MTDNENRKREGTLKRRDMLKVITAVPAALVPLGAATAAEPQKATSSAPVAGAYQRKVLNQHEWETVKVLSDLIIPADERSGSARQAGVPEFIDDWLNFQGGDVKAEILGGLTWFDLECNRLFNHDFIGCSQAQQKQILDRIAYPRTAAPEDASYVAFFSQFRDLVVGGFFSSEMGIKDLPYVGNKFVADYEGCPANVLAKIEENLKAKNIGLGLSNKDNPVKG
jgi:Gluconate 2-dehydrogenase subunit 3